MKNYFNAISNIEADVCNELVELLDRRGRGIDVDDEEDEIQFFNFDSISQAGIREIDIEGRVVGGDYDGSTVRNLLSDGSLILLDIIALVEELRDKTKVTAEDVLNWHGSEHGIEELAEYLAEIINGDVSLETARNDINSCKE